MKRDLLTRVLLVVAVVLLALNLIMTLMGTSSPSYAAKTTQYKVEFVPINNYSSNPIGDIQLVLDKYSNEGWELAAFNVDQGKYLIFKR